jgi:hypothetical protein
MLMLRIRLHQMADRPAVTLDPAVVTDIIWSAAPHRRNLQHVYAESAPGILDVILFLLATDGDQAVVAAQEILERARRQSSLLSEWIDMGDPPPAPAADPLCRHPYPPDRAP